jgi:hypothetical protein
MVFPEPGPPTRSVVRPLGRPPPVISSNPAMPVGAFASVSILDLNERLPFLVRVPLILHASQVAYYPHLLTRLAFAMHHQRAIAAQTSS